MPTADGAILGAHVRTLDEDRPTATAIAWRDGELIAVGADDEIRAVCGASTERVDGRGRTVLPGLTDSHIHPFWGTLATRGVDLRSAATLDEVRGRLAEERRALRRRRLGARPQRPLRAVPRVRHPRRRDRGGGRRRPGAAQLLRRPHRARDPARARPRRRAGRPAVRRVRRGGLRPRRAPDRRAARERRHGPGPRRRPRVDGGGGARRLLGDAARAQPGRSDGRARDGRRPGAPRHLRATRGARRPHRPPADADAPGALDHRRGGRRAVATRARARPAVACRDREVLPRRRARLRHGVARRPRPGRRQRASVLA